MMTMTIKGTEYKIYFSFNAFADSDLMERTEALIKIFDDKENKEDAYGMGRLKETFIVVRELLYEGFKKYNAVDSLTAVGDLMDDYLDEGTEEHPHDLLEIFSSLTTELMERGFLSGLTANLIEAGQKAAKKPQDHLKAQK
jgi:hypothetical protein